MKHLLQNQEFQLDEIIFQGRNKEYGAYALRNNSDRILTKAMFFGVLFFGVFAATPFVVNAFKAETVIIPNDPIGPYDITPIDDFPEVKPPVTTPQTQKVNTVDTRTPTPTRNAANDNPPAKVDDYDNAVPGVQDIKGDPPVLNVNPPAFTPQTGSGNINSDPPVVPKPPDNSIPDKVDVEASFAGGIEVFRSKVIQNFDTSEFEGTGDKLSTVVTFIVEKDGTISGIKTSGKNGEFNREAERTIKKIKGKWTPAKIKGEPVRSYFRFPVSMMFE